MKTVQLLAAISVMFTMSTSQAAPMKNVTLAAEQLKWGPLDPKQPNGIQIAVVSGDPSKGPASFFLKLKKGSPGFHTHTHDYEATLISGSSKHWQANEKEDVVSTLSPGSYFAQKGKTVHNDHCLSDECLVFIRISGKFDFAPAK